MMPLHSGEPAPKPIPVRPLATDTPDSPLAREPLSVLVVDDEPLIRWSLRQGLTKRGHRVVEAGTAVEALHLLSAVQPPFDVVILDYRLPDRRDLSLLKVARDLAPSSAFLMITAYSEPGMSEEAEALGARAVVSKPFKIAAFVSLVESL
jgi:DNA-binding NtrC family response regulator